MRRNEEPHGAIRQEVAGQTRNTRFERPRKPVLAINVFRQRKTRFVAGLVLASGGGGVNNQEYYLASCGSYGFRPLASTAVSTFVLYETSIAFELSFDQRNSASLC
mmetsp:Transcript_10151/g.23062  ORF Transcript_10151/g.23062 Transcript_10151/m.23062 type:complete len:106 (-) Transcript_10151:1610-1927(-)